MYYRTMYSDNQQSQHNNKISAPTKKKQKNTIWNLDNNLLSISNKLNSHGLLENVT